MLRLTTTLAAIAAATALAGVARADSLPGERVFKAQCGACHTMDAGKNRVGPSLHGIVGRKSGEVEGFRYSKANKEANLTWTTELLEKYLLNPKEVVPGTTMTYAGLKNPKQRADLIDYLAASK